MKQLLGAGAALLIAGVLLGACGSRGDMSGNNPQVDKAAAKETATNAASSDTKGAADTKEPSVAQEKCESFYPHGGGASAADIVVDDEGPTVILAAEDGMRTEYGLSGAAMNASVEALMKLKACGVDLNTPDAQGETALLLAVGSKAYASDSQEATKYDVVVDYLLEQKVNVNAKSKAGQTAYTVAYVNQDQRNVERLEPYATSEERATAKLYTELGNLTLKEVKRLVEQDHADVNAGFGQHEFPSFFAAVELGRTDVAAYLIQHGADLSLRPGDEGGISVLHYAVSFGNLPLTKLLLEGNYGFDVNEADGLGCPLLSRAVSQSDYEMVSYLIGQGAEVNVTYSDFGEELTILQNVDEENPDGLKIKQLLIEHGAK
ncbi:ankyrin repeat domain-containing protein [Paenibacillus macerans]|uniref:ankyrin repeat domain-containing protein n=1 Tax=Paenibacillus macerans TaxID=44252 RepID=UPI0022E71D6B|nr:ankyrin repeat domain-containing protein [Paenibacillus macerans]MEC0137484.1 ankyrin repeat domain-containing protein [Paenibacillus macerans]